MTDKKHILLVEDDLTLASVLEEMLLLEGYKMTLAQNGEDALEKLHELSDDLPDLILLDIIMPKMMGGEFYEKIKAKKSVKDIPVMVITNLVQTEGVVSSELNKAEGYVVKSNVSMKELLKKVAELLA